MKWLLGVICILLCPPLAVAQNERAPDVPELQVEIVTAGEPGGAIFVQQQVLLRITLVSRFPFWSLRIETPEIADAGTACRLPSAHQRILHIWRVGLAAPARHRPVPTRSGTLEIPAIRAAPVLWFCRTAPVSGSGPVAQSRVLQVQPAHPLSQRVLVGWRRTFR